MWMHKVAWVIPNLLAMYLMTLLLYFEWLSILKGKWLPLDYNTNNSVQFMTPWHSGTSNFLSKDCQIHHQRMESFFSSFICSLTLHTSHLPDIPANHWGISGVAILLVCLSVSELTTLCTTQTIVPANNKQ